MRSTDTELSALSGDATLLAHLRAPLGRGRVESVFQRVINLLLPDGRLMSLAARDGDNAPWTLVVDIGHWPGSGVDAGQPVEFTPGRVALPAASPALRIDLEAAKEWHTTLPTTLADLTADELAVAARALYRVTREHGSPGGMLGPSEGAWPMESVVCAALDEGRATLARAVRTGDPAGIRTGILALLGLGPGLTPAGDDFLTGLAVLSAIDGSRLGPYAQTLGDVLAEQPDRTTHLSVTTLREALAGRVRAALADVLFALAATRGQDPAHAADTIQDPVRRALAHGHTSGTDTVSGLVTGLHLEKELRGPL
ncbi:DUF2877 domain-containing protein [Streptomyces boninensis]|uniref:oxamate carbamoyltransferase subunit AllH family protein n=1 Tax=Streptomyces boninensis TaxID=2039455 RepID=UPI003B211FA9